MTQSDPLSPAEEMREAAAKIADIVAERNVGNAVDRRQSEFTYPAEALYYHGAGAAIEIAAAIRAIPDPAPAQPPAEAPSGLRLRLKARVGELEGALGEMLRDFGGEEDGTEERSVIDRARAALAAAPSAPVAGVSEEMVEALKTLLSCCVWQIDWGTDHHPTLPTVIAKAEATIRACDEALQEAKHENRNSKVRIAELEVALRWYGSSSDSWDGSAWMNGQNSMGWGCKHPSDSLIQDQGNRARAVLTAAPSPAKPDASEGGRRDMNSIAERVRRIVSECLGVEADRVVDGADFVDDFGADALDLVELVIMAEEEFAIEISDRDAEDLSTVGDAVRFFESKACGPTMPDDIAALREPSR